MMRSQIRTLAVAAAGLGIAAAVTACSAPGHPAGPAAPVSAPAGPRAAAQYPYSYYHSMMGRYFGGSVMGGSYRWMTSPAGYRWMTGGGGVPGWMRGGHIPGFMMGGGTGMGAFMGRLWANAPGPRVSPAQAVRLGSQTPVGAQVNRAAHTITIHARSARLTAVASPAGGPDETFRIAGLVNPAITVPAGARVSIEVINADPGTAHGLVITGSDPRSSPMPMMTIRPAFTGSALWFLGNPTPAGMHAGTLTFTASAPGTYHYLCPVPGHAQKGMTGLFTVSSSG